MTTYHIFLLRGDYGFTFQLLEELEEGGYSEKCWAFGDEPTHFETKTQAKEAAEHHVESWKYDNIVWEGWE